MWTEIQNESIFIHASYFVNSEFSVTDIKLRINFFVQMLSRYSLPKTHPYLMYILINIEKSILIVNSYLYQDRTFLPFKKVLFDPSQSSLSPQPQPQILIDLVFVKVDYNCLSRVLYK